MSEPGSTASARPADDRRRYPGVRPFEEQDRERFFGRTRATEELLLRVLSVRLLLQFAPSGVGKTSLLKAGLFPTLRQHDLFPFIVRLNEVKESLTQAVVRSLKEAATRAGLKEPVIPEDTESLWELLARVQLWSPDLLLLTPVLVFDQFEEVFTLREEAFRREFASEVGALTLGRAPQRAVDRGSGTPAAVTAPAVKVIISLREEYLGKLEELSAGIPDLFHERLRLAPLSGDEAREAIVEPARLKGDTWLSPPFEFDPPCLDELIDFIDGASKTVKVIEPLTLQLVCQRAEEIAIERARSSSRLPLHIDDFGGLAGLERLVQQFFTSELDKLGGAKTRERAREMFERGLLDPGGKRLMLEQGEIERDYGLDSAALDVLVGSRLLRREPRNESVFYEISHDRLTEAIARDRRPQLPRWVKMAIAVGVVLGFVLFAEVIRIRRASARMERASARTERALGVLLGEDLVSRLREAGLADALQRVLERADIDRSTKSLVVALSLRHEGDLLRERGTVEEARRKFAESLEALDAVQAVAGGSDPGLTAERARTLRRIGSVLEDAGQVKEAGRNYDQSVEAWDQVLKGQADPQQELDAAESSISQGYLRKRTGDTKGAEDAFTRALQVALNVLTAASHQAQAGRAEFFFDQGRAMQVYADAALNLASVWRQGEPEARAAHALAHESLRLRPLSAVARTQVGTAAATYGTVKLDTPDARSTPKSVRAAELFRDSRQQFDELAQWDPDNRRLQRESAALQLVAAEGTATCSETASCKATLGQGDLEGAEVAALDSTGRFRWLAGLDKENRSLKGDVGWGLQVQARVLRALDRKDKALRALDEAVAAYRESIVDSEDVEQRVNIPALLLEKAQILERGKPLEAMAALDASLAELARLPEDRVTVMTARLNASEAKSRVLRKLGRSAEADQLLEDNARLLQRLGSPWERKNKVARKANDEGLVLFRQAEGLGGSAAAEGLHKALEKYRRAIEEYPFEYVYWMNQRNIYQWIAGIEKDLEAAGASRTREREAALRGALTAAWMARVLSHAEDAAASWKALYEARRSLVQFLRGLKEHDVPAEVLPLVAQGVLDAEEYARREPGSPDSLFLLADANVGVALLRSETRKDGWEEAMRKGLAYGDRLARREPSDPDHRTWVGGFRRTLGDRLREVHREDAAVEEYTLGMHACREGLRLAAKGTAEQRDRAQSCLGELAALGYK